MRQDLSHRSVEAGRREDEWRMVCKATDVYMVFVDFVEVTNHLENMTKSHMHTLLKQEE